MTTLVKVVRVGALNVAVSGAAADVEEFEGALRERDELRRLCARLCREWLKWL